MKTMPCNEMLNSSELLRTEASIVAISRKKEKGRETIATEQREKGKSPLNVSERERERERESMLGS